VCPICAEAAATLLSEQKSNGGDPAEARLSLHQLERSLLGAARSGTFEAGPAPPAATQHDTTALVGQRPESMNPEIRQMLERFARFDTEATVFLSGRGRQCPPENSTKASETLWAARLRCAEARIVPVGIDAAPLGVAERKKIPQGWACESPENHGILARMIQRAALHASATGGKQVALYLDADPPRPFPWLAVDDTGARPPAPTEKASKTVNMSTRIPLGVACHQPRVNDLAQGFGGSNQAEPRNLIIRHLLVPAHALVNAEDKLDPQGTPALVRIYPNRQQQGA